MKAGVTSSVVAHAALLIVAIVGLGSAKPYEPEVVESIAVDLVPISDFTNIRAGSLKSEVVETETPAITESDKPAELAQPTGNTEQDQAKPEETAKETPAPVVNTAPEPTPEVQPEPEPDPVEEKPPEPQPVEAPEPAAAPEETAPAPELATPETEVAPEQVAPKIAPRPANLGALREKVKKAQIAEAAAKKKAEDEAKRIKQAKVEADKQAREADAIDQILNQEKSRGATTGAGGTPTLGKTTGTAATLSQDQLGALGDAMKKNWNTFLIRSDRIIVEVEVRLAQDGSVIGTPTLIQAAGTSLDNTALQAAIRSIKQGAPYDLPLDKYDAWQVVHITFDPIDQ
jgi:hypothetical protein